MSANLQTEKIIKMLFSKKSNTLNSNFMANVRITAEESALDQLVALSIAEYRVKTNGEKCKEAYISQDSLQSYLDQNASTLQSAQNALQEMQTQMHAMQTDSQTAQNQAQILNDLCAKLNCELEQLPAIISDYKNSVDIVSQLSADFACHADELHSTIFDKVNATNTDNRNKSLKIADLEQQLQTAQQTIHQPTKFTDFIKPFPAKLLQATADKLSKIYKKPITPESILVDMFLKYTIQQYNVWFYDFVLSNDEILAIAREVNPEIKSFQQIKQHLPNRPE